MSLSKQPSSIPSLSTGDATSDYDKANCLNKQFYNHFNYHFNYLHSPLITVSPQAYIHKPVVLS